jgi:hypothetical protein
VSYVEIRMDDRVLRFGVGMDSNIVTASLNAVVSAVNWALRVVAGDTVQEREILRRVIRLCV